MSSADDRIKGGLEPGLAVEQEWIRGASADGPVIEPGISISNAPKGDALQGGAVLEVDAKQLCITPGQGQFHLRRQSVGVASFR